MRAQVPITIGLSFGLTALSLAERSAGVTVLVACGTMVSVLAFGSWVLSAEDRTRRLELLIRALRGRPGRPRRTAKDRQKK